MISLFLAIIITTLFIGLLLGTLGMLLDSDFGDAFMLVGVGVLSTMGMAIVIFGIVALWTLALTGG